MTPNLALSLGTLASNLMPPPPLKFAGAGGRVPNAAQPAKTVSTLFSAGDFAFRMPQTSVPITELWFFFPTFYAPTGGEIDTPGYTVEGMAVRNIGTGARTTGLMDDGTSAVAISAGSSTSPGAWIKFTPAAPLAAGSLQLFSVAQAFTDGAVLPRTTWRPVSSRVRVVDGDNRLATLNNESAQGGSTSRLSTLSGSTTYNNTGGDIVRPSHMLCRMAAGEPSVVMAGDSILADDFSFMELVLEDTINSARVACGSFAVAGWEYIDTDTGNSHANATAAARQFKIIEMARALNGGRPVADHFFSNHGTNSSTQPVADQRRSFRTLHSVWRDMLGCNASSHSDMLPFPQSTDGYNTLVNQTVAASQDYPTGQRWLINEDISGPDGLGDLTAAFRADGTIVDRFSPWRISGADLTTQRDLLSVRPFNTTLAAAFSGSGNTLSLTAQPTVGDILSINNGATFCSVTAVSGSGPFSTTVIFVSGGTVPASSGANVRSCWHDTTGLHPSTLAHIAYAFDEDDGAINWKIRRNWVPATSAPVITSSSITGTPENGQVLTANATFTGFPAPALTYRWQRNNGANISGQTAQTITLNEGTMSLADGDTISCEITATSSQGVATAEPSVTYSGAAEVAAYLALINGNANAGFFDFTDATAPGGVFTAVDANGGASFVAPASFQSPGISGTLGALMNGTNKLIQRTVASGTYDVALTFVKDAGNTSGRLLNSTSEGVYVDGSATAASPTIEVNGTGVATQNAFHGAINTAAEETIFFQGVSIAGTLLFLGSTSFTPLGSIRRVAFYPAADRATRKAAAIAAVEAV